MRRSLLAATAAAAVVLALPTAAYAASVRFTSPTADAVVAENAGVRIEVEVQRTLGETVHGVETRLRPVGGGDALPSIVALECVEPGGCDQIGDLDARWGGATLTPDADGYAAGEVCNGAYHLEARPDGESGWPAVTRVVLGGPPGHIAWLDAVARDREVTLTWSRDAAPDVRHVVERRPAGGSTWTERAVLGGDTGTFTETVTAGDHDYRIVAVRGDGIVDGAAVTPCTDTARDHVLASPPVTVTAASGTTSPTPAPSSGDDGGAGTGEGDGAATSGGDAPSVGSSDGDDGATGSDGTTSGRRRVAAPPPAERTGPDTSTPTLGDAPAAEERYYGADEGYADELDYDGVGAVAEDRPVTAAGRLVSGGVERVRDLEVDLPRILGSMAAGATLIGAAFHLRRWSRET